MKIQQVFFGLLLVSLNLYSSHGDLQNRNQCLERRRNVIAEIIAAGGVSQATQMKLCQEANKINAELSKTTTKKPSSMLIQRVQDLLRNDENSPYSIYQAMKNDTVSSNLQSVR